MIQQRANLWRGAASVIVPTHDRAESLVRLLRALAASGVTHPNEVVVVADGCTPETARSLDGLSFPYPVRLIEQQPAQGAALARNAGAREASGDLLLFIDDDIEPFGDVVGEHLGCHDGVPRVVIGAPRTPRGRTMRFREFAGWAWWEQQFERMRAPGYRFGYDDVFTGVLSMPRSLWRTVGGFDTTLQCREDFELGLRLVRHRVEFVFSERGGGWHHENRSGARLVRRKHDEGAADVALARLHPWSFPALRLANGAADTRADLVRRMAFEWPRVGGWGARLADRMLDVLEALRMRGAWRRVHGGIMYFAYWRGAASALDGWESLTALRDAAKGAKPPDYRELELDLSGDLAVVQDAVEREQPDLIRLRVGAVPLGVVGFSPGRVPLRGLHIASLPGSLDRALIAARALAELRTHSAESPPASDR